MTKVKMLSTFLIGLLFFVGLLLLALYFWVGRNFYNATLDIIVIHLILPLKGADSRYFWEGGVLAASVFIVTILFLIGYTQSRKQEKFLGLRGSSFRILALGVSVALFAGSTMLIEMRYNVYNFLFPGDLFSSFVEDNIKLPDVDSITFPEGSNNLVLIILESVENTVNDKTHFNPILMPRLDALAKGGIQLFGQRQVVGTEFSLSGFFALTLGMPAKSNFNTRDVVNIAMGRMTEDDLKYDDLMGEREWQDYSILGILEKNGHSVSLMRAADARFCRYDSMMWQSTRQCDIWDLMYFINNKVIEKAQNNWGVDDSFLYARARDYLLENNQKGPFTMIIQTVDTHQPGMYEPGMARPYGDHRDSFVQADALAADFVEWVQEQPFGKDTTIVLVGDHLTTMGTIGAVTLPPASERSTMAFILNSRKAPIANIGKRLFATWDLAPTILEAVGANVPQSRFGLGTSLFSPSRNLLERVGISQYNKNIRKRSHFSEKYYGW